MQIPLFSEAPLPSAQAAAWLQVLDAQTSPVADVQALDPQRQGAGLTAPSPWRQAGPVKVHKHALELS